MKTVEQALTEFLLAKSRNLDINLYKNAAELAKEFCANWQKEQDSKQPDYVEMLRKVDEYYKNTPKEEILALAEKYSNVGSEGPTVEEYLDGISGGHENAKNLAIEFAEWILNPQIKYKVIAGSNEGNIIDWQGHYYTTEQLFEKFEKERNG